MYKKNIILFILIFLIVYLIPAGTGNGRSVTIQQQILEVTEQISQTILKEYPDMSVRKGIVILGFKEESPQARKNKIGSLVQVYLEEALTKSMLLYLVDRRNLDAIQEEYALALSGLTDESTSPQPGYLKGARFLLFGSILEENSAFRVSISMTDTTTGEMLFTSGFNVPNKEMLDAAEELQYEYVAKNGIGLSSSFLLFITGDADFNSVKPVFVDMKVKYRLSRSLLLSAGIMIPMPLEFYRLEDKDNNLYWSDFQTSSDFPSALDTVPVGQVSNNFVGGMILHLDLQYTLNFTPAFNLGFNFGALFSPYLASSYKISSNSGLYVKDYEYDNNNYTVSKDRTAITLEYKAFGGVKFELIPELFLTPRLALSGLLGYMVTTNASVYRAYAENGDWGFYAESLATNYNDFVDDIYFGFDPSLMPGGDPWSINFSGLYGGLTFTLFF